MLKFLITIINNKYLNMDVFIIYEINSYMEVRFLYLPISSINICDIVTSEEQNLFFFIDNGILIINLLIKNIIIL